LFLPERALRSTIAFLNLLKSAASEEDANVEQNGASRREDLRAVDDVTLEVDWLSAVGHGMILTDAGIEKMNEETRLGDRQPSDLCTSVDYANRTRTKSALVPEPNDVIDLGFNRFLGLL
jgi:hypothetical protein